MIKKRKLYIFFGLVIFCCLLGYFFVYKLKFNNRGIRSDGAGYYAYLPAFLIYKDFSLEKADFYQVDAKYLDYPAIYFSHFTQRYVNKYPIGVALLVLPFFSLAHLISSFSGLPMTGYTLIYQYFVRAAGPFYLIIGLYFLMKVYQSNFSLKTAMISLLSLVFATNLFHYAVNDNLMSHVFSFFLISTYLYLLFDWKRDVNWSKSFLVGLVLGLVFLVRNTNLIFAFALIPFVKRNLKYFSVIMLAFLIVCLSQFLYWKYSAGKYLLFSYQGEGFNFLNPQIYGVLFSPRKGLFFWSPIFLLGFLGVGNLKKKIGPLFYSFLFVILIFVFLAASWYDWAFGASFGHRAFIDLYPILGLFLAAGLEKLIKKIGFRKTAVILIFLIFLNLTNMIKYWQGILPHDHTTLEVYFKNLFKVRNL